MTLKKIHYQGFRNLADTELVFAEAFNFIIGDNGAGKTNLLEAIYYVGLASSFRAKEEKHLICRTSDHLRVDAETDGKNAAVYLDSDRKKLTLGGNDVQRLSDYIGWLGITLLSIEDIWLIRGAPARRRSFLDWMIAKMSPRYCGALTEYKKIIRQRNRALQIANETGKHDVLDVFDEQMIQTGNDIYAMREDYMPQIKEHTARSATALGLKKFDVSYASSCHDMRMDRRTLERIRLKEIVRGHSIIGPHRDDLIFMLEGRRLQDFASEGEERSAAIALRLAEAEILYNQAGTRPIMLLDEVTAELDHARRDAVLGLLNGQIFYASTQLPPFASSLKDRHHIFTAQRGHFEISSQN
jgi:DNA replication and repair protein RecF